jgi:hypothetical protein
VHLQMFDLSFDCASQIEVQGLVRQGLGGVLHLRWTANGVVVVMAAVVRIASFVDV